MYGTPPVPPAAGGTLAATGTSVFLGSIGYGWAAVAVLVIGGTLLAMAKLAPRLAIEPVRTPGETQPRVRLTYNGHPTRLRDIPGQLFRKKRN